MDGAPDAARESLGAALQGGDPAIAQRAIDAFVNGMHTSVIVAAGAALTGAVVAAVFLPRRDSKRSAVAPVLAEAAAA